MNPADPSIDPAGAALAKTLHNTFLFLALLTAFEIAFLTGIWMWKKWGVYGYGAIASLGLIVGLRVSPTSSMVNLVWAIMVAVAIASKWRHFE